MHHRATNPRRSIVVADMPWSHQAWSKTDEKRTATAHYACMTDQEMLDLAPYMKAAFPDQSMLFMWTTGPQMPFSLELMKAYGYTFKTKAFTWLKLNSKFADSFQKLAHTHINGMPLSSDEIIQSIEMLFKPGMGHYTRANPEYVIVGKKGKEPIMRMRKNIREIVFSPIGEHSSKPDEVNKRIELLMRRPQDEMFELFARRQYADWNCTGLEFDGLDIRDALTRYARGERGILSMGEVE